METRAEHGRKMRHRSLQSASAAANRAVANGKAKLVLFSCQRVFVRAKLLGAAPGARAKKQLVNKAVSYTHLRAHETDSYL
eukprot:4642808-Pleurochrysis_carterae.AAC.2